MEKNCDDPRSPPLASQILSATYLEASRAPIDELDCTLGFDRGDSGVDILRHDVTTVQQADGHIFAMSRIAFDHLVLRLEAHIRNVGD